ncbi:MAG: NAD-dependent DNA ligase LigA [Lachnospirales bacterium]
MEKKIVELIEKLLEAEYSYYNEDVSIISDFEYDKLYDELKELEEKTGIIKENSPTQRVQYVLVDKLKKVEHSKPMLSLQKTKSVDELVAFLGNEDGLLSYKLDGLTVVLTYSGGELKLGATRGNGRIGEDITHNASVFSNVPKHIDYNNDLVIRGEAIITFSNFNKINNKLESLNEEIYKNPRNLCSGSVRQLNSKIAKERNIKFIAFGIVQCDEKFKSKEDELDFLKKLNFEIVDYKIVNKESLQEEVLDYEKKLVSEDYATDGLVLTFNDNFVSLTKGETSKFPHHSIAFKWKDELVTTKLIDVLWNTSRGGTINPVALFEAVDIEGTTVERASLHNLSIFESLELGINDEISVYKANMIIPQVYENFTKSNTLEAPKKCPSCGSDTVIKQVKEGKTLNCINENCPSKNLYKYSHFVSRDAMNIEGLSEATLSKLIEEGFIKTYKDIYLLDRYKEDILTLEGFGIKKYENILNSIEKSKTVLIENFIYALGIPTIGLQNSKLLVKKLNVKNFDEMINLSNVDLISVDGFGDIMANSFVEYFNNESNIVNCRELYNLLNVHYNENTSVDTFSDKIFVITGDLNTFNNRKELQVQIENLGGKVSSSVSKNTTYLINNDKLSNSSKNKKAKELGVDIISEEDFLNMIKGGE